jgi:hypothetical protein
MKGIFINYRRDDAISYAGRVYDRISTHFGKERVFMDIDTILPGDDFRQSIDQTCASSAVILALIAKSWATVTDRNGRRRIDNPNDLVRLELKQALTTGVRVIPVLLDDAEIPDPENLPDDLKSIAYRQAIHISSLRFHQDVDRLIEVLEKILAKVDAEQLQSGAGPAQARRPQLSGARPAQAAQAQQKRVEYQPRSEPAQTTSNQRATKASFVRLLWKRWTFPLTRWQFWAAVAVWPAMVLLIHIFGLYWATPRQEEWYRFSYATYAMIWGDHWIFVLLLYFGTGLLLAYSMTAVKPQWIGMVLAADFGLFFGGMACMVPRDEFSHFVFVFFVNPPYRDEPYFRDLSSGSWYGLGFGLLSLAILRVTEWNSLRKALSKRI